MPKNKDKNTGFHIEVSPDKIVSDGNCEVTIKCIADDRRYIRENVDVTFAIPRLRLSETCKTQKGIATYKFKPAKPTARTEVICNTPSGELKTSINITPTPAQYTRDMIQSVLLAFIVAFGIIKPFLLGTYYVPSGSMEETLFKGDRLFGLMFTYRFRDPHPGEIIVFKYTGPGQFAPKKINIPIINKPYTKYTYYIKRVIAREGDTVEVRNMTVYVNGHPLDEPYAKEPPMADFPLVKVPKGKLFMMGDNRNNSFDSRYWGFLDRKMVVSKAVVKFWPPDRMGTMPQPDMTQPRK